MKRIPEPELMDDAEQARAYAMADFSEPHQAFVEHFTRRFPNHEPCHVLDLGCGPADISIRFARAYPGCQVTGVDGAAAMLTLGRDAVRAAAMVPRITLLKLHLPGEVPGRRGFDTIISNSLLHHLTDPMVLWQTLKNTGAQSTVVFMMDLMRPDSRDAAAELVERHSGDEPEVLKRDFFNSLLAAYQPQEVRSQVLEAGLAERLKVQVVSDRHLIVWGYLP